MGNLIFTQGAKFLHERRKNRRWRVIVCCLALVIVCGITWGLLQNGHAMTRPEGVLDCQFEIHEHDESCYAEGQLACGKVEYVVHTHDESCYDESDELTCQLPEETGHVHDKSCFETETVLICEQTQTESTSYEESAGEETPEDTMADAAEESPVDMAVETEAFDTEMLYASEETTIGLVCVLDEHQHGEECYSGGTGGTPTLVCTQIETDDHTHNDSCYQETTTQICTNTDEDHIHDANCYVMSKVLVCVQSESQGHRHTDECYVMSEGELSCNLGEHKHTEECYGEMPGEETWIPSDGQSTPDVSDASNSPENDITVHEHDDSCYRVVRKYAVCGTEGVHIHDDSCYQDGSLICEVPVVESLEEHSHDENCFKAEENVTYAKIYEDDDIRVTVSYLSSAKIAKDAELLVEKVTDEESLRSYEQLLEEKEALTGADNLALLLRMGFYTDDEIFVPKDEVSVTVEFLNGTIYADDDEVTAASFTKDNVELISGKDGSVSFETAELPELAFIVAGEDVHTLTYTSDDYIVTVTLDEETDVPENAELVVEETTQENGLSHYEERFAELEEDSLLDEEETIALLLDMWITVGGEKMSLDRTADVTIQFLNNDIYLEGDKVKAAYFTENGVDLLSASDTDSENATTFKVDELAEVAFITVGDMRVMKCEGDGFIVTVRFGPKALIPETALLDAERITQENDPDCFAEHEDKLKDYVETEENENIELNLLMKIGFYVDDEEIEPQDTVDVKIQLLDREDIKKGGSNIIRMAHFAKDGIEQLENADVVEDEENSLSMTFQTDSFSYFVFFSVDDGKIVDAQSFYNAITNATSDQELKLENSFSYPGNSGLSAAELKTDITLNLNGYTITLERDNGENNITLINIIDKGTLTVTDNPDGGSNPYSQNYTYYVTDAEVLDDRGRTSTDTSQKTVTGGAIVGNKDNGNAMFYMQAGTSLTIKGGIFTGNGGSVVDAAGATVTLDGGYLINNKRIPGDESRGGAIRCKSESTLTINKDAILSGNSGTEGGAIYAAGSTVTMNGGYVTNNMSTKAGWSGGGIRTDNTIFTVKDGYITGNTAHGSGGGIAACDGQSLILEGGYISGNCTTTDGAEGGGIAVMMNTVAEIGRTGSGHIYITNNVAGTNTDWGGGGIFIYENASVYMFNTLITNNHANGFGGGVGGCSTGRISEINPFQGAAIFGNTADGTARAGAGSFKHQDSEYTDEEKNPVFWFKNETDGRNLFNDYFSAMYSNLSNEMLAGGSENWDGTADGVRINKQGGRLKSSYICGLTAYPSEEDKRKAIDAARVFINGNSSNTHGGGIMCNGVLAIGSNGGDPAEIEVPSRIELTATKKLEDAAGKSLGMVKDQFVFAVYTDVDCSQCVMTAKNDEKGNIAFGQLVFDLERDGYGSEHEYCYYIKEENLPENPENFGIVTDDTVYRMAVTVKKTDHGETNKVKTYIDDIVRIKIESGTIENGQYKSKKVIYEDIEDNKGVDGYSKYSDQTHPFVVSLTSDGMRLTEWWWKQPEDAEWDGNTTEQKKMEDCNGISVWLFKNFGDATFVNKKTTITEITVEKKWSDDIRLTADDSVTVSLYQNGKLYEEGGKLVLSNENEWKGSWKNLPSVDSEGKECVYTVEETDVTNGQLTDYDIKVKSVMNAETGIMDVTITNTLKWFGIDLFKNNEEGEPLARAGFQVTANGIILSFVQTDDGYVLDKGDGTSQDTSSTKPEVVDTLYTGVDGKLKVSGLDEGEYVLKEVKVPFGYTAVPEQKITLGTEATHVCSLELVDKVEIYRLPEFGGSGTGIFYTLGSIMVLGSGIILVTRKRMSSRNNESN